jgi:enoyl-[acyl-carrier-protein] reductase (NADH)
VTLAQCQGQRRHHLRKLSLREYHQYFLLAKLSNNLHPSLICAFDIQNQQRITADTRKMSKKSGAIDNIKARAKEVAYVPLLKHTQQVLTNIYSEEDFNKAKDLARSAAESKAYLYPIKVNS